MPFAAAAVRRVAAGRGGCTCGVVGTGRTKCGTNEGQTTKRGTCPAAARVASTRSRPRYCPLTRPTAWHSPRGSARNTEHDT
eukprot:scaffold9876_cov50-Phaeocystis_antarctica.AAC.5